MSWWGGGGRESLTMGVDDDDDEVGGQTVTNVGGWPKVGRIRTGIWFNNTSLSRDCNSGLLNTGKPLMARCWPDEASCVYNGGWVLRKLAD